MRTARSIPFAEFRSFLEGLGYQAKRTDEASVFHHSREGLLVFRLYDEQEPVDSRDLLSTRKFLDGRGLLDVTAFAAFDAFLQRATTSA
jgi:hypothetical protein